MALLLILVVIVGIALLYHWTATKNMSEEEKDNYYDTAEHGKLRKEIICPHCQTKGQIRTKETKRKKGISGAKATGALLTGGLSILATGLSRKEVGTEAYCGNCKSICFF